VDGAHWTLNQKNSKTLKKFINLQKT